MKINFTDLTFKPMSIDTIPLLLELQEDAFAHAGDSTDFLRRNTYETLAPCFDGDSLVLGAFHGDLLVAFGILYCAGDTKENLAHDLDEVEDITENANVKLVIVRYEYRGNGLQKELIRRLCIHAEEKGYRWLSSTVSPENPWSMNNLIANGFTEAKVLVKYGGLKRILYAKKI